MPNSNAQKTPAPNRGARVSTAIFATLLGAAYLWVVITPIVPAISMAGMKRFNLRSDSFTGWALQQPVPSMYNFANRGAVITGELEENAVPVATNHFPTRQFTFRIRSAYEPALPQVLLTSSTFQGRTVRARHFIEKAPGGGTRMVLEPRK